MKRLVFPKVLPPSWESLQSLGDTGGIKAYPLAPGGDSSEGQLASEFLKRHQLRPCWVCIMAQPFPVQSCFFSFYLLLLIPGVLLNILNTWTWASKQGCNLRLEGSVRILFFLFFRDNESRGEVQRDRQREADSAFSSEPSVGLDSMTLGQIKSWTLKTEPPRCPSVRILTGISVPITIKNFLKTFSSATPFAAYTSKFEHPTTVIACTRQSKQISDKMYPSPQLVPLLLLPACELKVFPVPLFTSRYM